MPKKIFLYCYVNLFKDILLRLKEWDWLIILKYSLMCYLRCIRFTRGNDNLIHLLEKYILSIVINNNFS